jgi:chaperonin cofactor prefoldin
MPLREPMSLWVTDHGVISQECTNKGRTLLFDLKKRNNMTREEAIEKIRKMSLPQETMEILSALAPELAESDDERIINQLITLVNSTGEILLIPTNKEELIAWLNKCKESLHVSKTCKENADSFTDEYERIRRTLVEYFGPEVQLDFVRGVPIQKIRAWLEKNKYEYEVFEPIENTLEYKAGFKAGIESEKQKEQEPDSLIYDKDLDKAAREFYLSGGADSPVDSTGLVPIVRMAEFGATWMKERMEKEQKPAKWSDTDNIGWDEAFACVTRAEKAAKNEEELQNAVTAEKWLKEIKFKYYVHPVKPEWSEEDERMLSRCIKSVECSKQFADSETYKVAKDVEMNWLKSLRPPQYCENCKLKRSVENWKPSEEQMEALSDACVEANTFKKGDILESLYNDLKKLM